MKRNEKRAVIAIVCVIIALIAASFGVKMLRRFDYTDHLDETVITVDEKSITLREFGYYIFRVEAFIQKQALIYDPEDPVHWWHIHFDAGEDSQFVSDYAKTFAVSLCIAEEIYFREALSRGMTLDENEEDMMIDDAMEMLENMEADQMAATGLDKEMVLELSRKHALASKYAAWLAGSADLTAYQEEPAELVDWDGAYYREVILPAHTTLTNDRILDKISLGTITVN
ncbi:MAG: hypothetical protein J6X17_10165 [Lachnospiraceae bacterium]|nr:hypothetical protein [Lachnospiraceae bacterium]